MRRPSPSRLGDVVDYAHVSPSRAYGKPLHPAYIKRILVQPVLFPESKPLHYRVVHTKDDKYLGITIVSHVRRILSGPNDAYVFKAYRLGQFSNEKGAENALVEAIRNQENWITSRVNYVPAEPVTMEERITMFRSLLVRRGDINDLPPSLYARCGMSSREDMIDAVDAAAQVLAADSLFRFS